MLYTNIDANLNYFYKIHYNLLKILEIFSKTPIYGTKLAKNVISNHLYPIRSLKILLKSLIQKIRCCLNAPIIAFIRRLRAKLDLFILVTAQLSSA
jgi:hypothetical protein